MAAKIEILKGGIWLELELKKSSKVKYNVRINKIGETSNRQIGSTNTFSLPLVSSNIQILDINIYNQYTLAKALNRKYEARYSINDKLIKSGFLLINNTKNGNINVNFIDEALDIVSKWGSITYKELLEDETLPIESDYQTSISELRNYSMPVNTLLSHLPTLGSRGYNLCLFPNNINAIGESFQITSTDIREDDSFNPYQSRPIFNAMSLFDLACERYGYTGIFDSSVDWDSVKETYFISEENDKNDDGDSGESVTNTYPSIDSTTHFSRYSPTFLNKFVTSKYIMKFPTSNSVQPSSFSNWKDNQYIYDTSSSWSYNPVEFWRNSNTVFTPNLQAGNSGDIRFTADITLNSDPDGSNILVVAYWMPTNQANDVISEGWGTESGVNQFPPEITSGVDFDLDITINKNLFNAVPAGADYLIGISLSADSFSTNGNVTTMKNMQVIESSLTGDVISFDKFDQYENNVVDFTYAASRKTLKTLMTSIMHKEGILMDINDTTKEIKFFTYDHYKTQVENGIFEIWDDYLLEYNSPRWETNYGNKYGKINEISLSEPFKGNSYLYELENQGELSRYQDKALDKLSNFKDVSQVFKVNNTLSPYTEYTSKGLGLVEFRGELDGLLAQVRAEGGVSPGKIADLPLIANVNYATIPDGVEAWYNLIDNAVRVNPQFLLPLDVIKNLDLSKPIYIGKLGGFYIIEEVSEYISSDKSVSVKLIKLVTELGVAPPVEPIGSITLSSVAFDGSPSKITNTISFVGYTPTEATITGSQQGEFGPTGFSFQTVLNAGNGNLPPYTNNVVEWTFSNPTGSEAGLYRIRVVDSDGRISNVEYVTIL